MVSLSLEWQRPRDGVEIVPISEAYPGLIGATGEVIRGRTERLTPISIRVNDLSDPIAIRLINAKAVEDLAQFVARFGIVEPTGFNEDMRGEGVTTIESLRDDLHDGMTLLNSKNDLDRVAWAAEHLHTSHFFPSVEWDEKQCRQRLVFKPKTLADLMRCEVAIAIEAEAALHRCGVCGAAFLTGHTTGRRATAVYCTDRCRMVALRARNRDAKF